MNEPAAQSGARVTGRTRDLVLWVDRRVYQFTFHWIAFVNLLLVLYIGPTFLAPYLMETGHVGVARLIYTVYGPPACHQRPERTFFLFGPQPAYTLDELIQAGMDPTLTAFERRLFYGSPTLGYKMAFCQRDIAIYAGVLLFGVLYAAGGRRWLRPLPWWGLALLLLPLAIDGFTQTFGLRESTPDLRVITGIITAGAGVWFIYPYVDAAMLDLRRDVKRKLEQASETARRERVAPAG
jgi:uncharacterized membrane protein